MIYFLRTKYVNNNLFFKTIKYLNILNHIIQLLPGGWRFLTIYLLLPGVGGFSVFICIINFFLGQADCVLEKEIAIEKKGLSTKALSL